MSETKQERQQQQLKDIENPGSNDIIGGRGKGIMNHPGNQLFREMIINHMKDFQSTPLKNDRKKIVAKIVDDIYNLSPPGRFLKEDVRTKLWYDIGRSEALVKTRKALRDGATESSNTTGSVRDLTEKKDGVIPEADFAKTSAPKHSVGNRNDGPKVYPSTETRQCTTLTEASASTYEEKDKLISEGLVAQTQEQVTHEYCLPDSSALNHPLEYPGQSEFDSNGRKRQCLAMNYSSLLRMNYENRVRVGFPVFVLQPRIVWLETITNQDNAAGASLFNA